MTKKTPKTPSSKFFLSLLILFFIFGCNQNDQTMMPLKPPISESEHSTQIELGTPSLISSKEIAQIKPVIQQWLDFYKIDLIHARLIRSHSNICLNCPPEQDLYFRSFTSKDDANDLIEVDYAPDKQRYINLGILYEYRENQRYSVGWDDSQEIYLTDRKLKQHNMILWLGSSAFAEAAFWQNNEVFIIVGYDLNAPAAKHFIDVFDIEKKSINHYEIMINDGVNYQAEAVSGYMEQVNMKSKGIIIE